MISIDDLWKHVIQECAPKWSTLHGVDHWRRVERNGRILATQPGVNETVVRLFALFHDSQRQDDGFDLEHGPRAAEYVRMLHGVVFELPDDDFERLQYACEWHTTGGQHDDLTIGACWDADRLDLGRVGIIPSAEYMSTDLGREIANYGSLQPWAHLAPSVWGTTSL